MRMTAYLLCGWILWSWNGQTLTCDTVSQTCQGWYEARSKAVAGFDTRKECVTAQNKRLAEIDVYRQESEIEARRAKEAGESTYRFAHIRDPECWPVGHTPD